MNMKREDRFQLIRIGGERIANVDYGQLFPRLAYVRARASQPQSDIYDIAGDGASRDGWKKLFNALLFAARPLKRWPEETRTLFPESTKLPEMLRKIREKHAPIAHLFEHGIGFALMFIESEMIIAALENLYRRGIDALPLHDSVLVAQSHATTAREILEAVFDRYTGNGCATVEIDLGPEN